MVLDTEVLIPAVAHKLARDHDDADGTRAYEVLFLRDRDVPGPEDWIGRYLKVALTGTTGATFTGFPVAS